MITLDWTKTKIKKNTSFLKAKTKIILIIRLDWTRNKKIEKIYDKFFFSEAGLKEVIKSEKNQLTPPPIRW